MAWTDGIFGHPPDYQKIVSMGKLALAAYDVSYASSGVPVTAIQKLTDLDQPGVYLMEIAGDQIVMVPGTTRILEITAQDTGWDVPLPFAGGVINSFYLGLAKAIFSSCPFNVKLYCGHSMGGALAIVLAKLAKDAGLPVRGALAFASPRPVDQDALLGNWPSVINVINSGDTVPEFPGVGKGLLQYNWYTPGEQYLLTPGKIQLMTQQPPSNVGLIASFIKDVLFYGHSMSTYVQLLLSAIPSSFTGSPKMAFAQIRVNGQLMGQRVNNVMHYLLTGNFSAAAYASAFRELWRSSVLTAVADDYTVDSYEVAIIAGVVPQNLVSVPVKPLWRYSDKASVAGTSLDKGSWSSSTSNVSFTAYGAKKTCGPWQIGDGGTFGVPTNLLTKSPRGGIRFAGVLDGDTPDNSNRLISTAITQWTTVLDQLKSGTFPSLSPGVGGYEMAVATMTNQGAIIPNASTVSGFGYWVAKVNGLTINPFVTSQVSRKQTQNRLG